jgi:gluconolactonase
MIRKLTMVSLLSAAVISAAAIAQSSEQGSVVRLDPALDDIVAPNAKVEQLADMPGQFTREGPAWVRDGGYLIYTVRNGNRQPGSPPPTDSDIIKWDPRDGKVSVLVQGIKTDGNTLDEQGRIIAAVNIGEGQLVRLEKDGKRTVLAREYAGKPINPNDLICKSGGVLYFSSPPRWGNTIDTPSLFMLKNGKLQLLSPTPAANIEHPGGLAFSADEKHLYVTNNPKVMKFDVAADNTIANGRVFVDMTDQKPLSNFPDGVKVDTQGNVYVTGPGGVWVLSPQGKHLGTINVPNRPANLAFGADDGKTLFITSRPGLYRIPLKVAGPLP